ncbi:MAG: RNA polymerase sigma factor [Proteobacteria bacterium]|nr:RNA polymerase sigma factor [Pseudomonadota bacterium]NOG59705.1 RNA polymerase sigma factor [Pseudomonadota bacterium]
MARLEDEVNLIKGLQKGEQASCKRLVELFWKDLNFLANRLLGDESIASDCVQEAFIKAITKIDSYEGRGTFKAWLHQIVVNEALIEIRKKSARKEESLDELMLEFDESGHHVEPYQGNPVNLDVLQESIEVKQQLQKSIDRLPDNFRLILILRDYEGYSTREVSEKMNMTEQNVKVRLHRARLAMRNLLQPVLSE